MNQYITIAVTALIVIVLAKVVLNLNLKKIIGLIINAVVGFIIIWLINKTGLIVIPLNWITSILVGITGIPGVILLIILVYFGII